MAFAVRVEDSGGRRNVVERITFQDRAIVSRSTVFDFLPSGGGHEGGRLAFEEDGVLYLSTGDNGKPELAQDLNLLSGKVLRVRPDGAIPDDNLFPGSPVYAYGFRNVFGIYGGGFGGHADVVVTDNGPDCNDEVDLLVPGGNFGWGTGTPCIAAPGTSVPDRVLNPPRGVTGVAVARGDFLRQWEGDLLVADYVYGEVTRVPSDSAEQVEKLPISPVAPLLDIAVAEDGAVYLASTNGVFVAKR